MNTAKTSSLPPRTVELAPVSWARMIRAVEKVRERLLRATGALDAAGIPYAVVGGNAFAAHVSRVDEAAVRNTRDVNLLLRDADLADAKRALAAAGFTHRRVTGLGMPGSRCALPTAFAERTTPLWWGEALPSRARLGESRRR